MLLMCGIAGQVDFEGRSALEVVSALTDATRHRGPDDVGLWQAANGNCVLGHRRLSIIDLSPAGHQPMRDSVTGNVLVFNGEIYNFRELRKECERAGESFSSQSDTEVILALYRREGARAISRLRGMFAFALWDEHANKLLLARDRVGKKPLNYILTPHGVIFCSEIEPLARHAAISAEIDCGALDLYLQLQYVPAPWTIYRSIRKLPPAHYAEFDCRGVRIERYWNVDYTRKLTISEPDAIEGLEERLTEAIRLRMIADVPLGALLSGGVDSSVVVALMSRLAGEPVRTFSIGFGDAAFNELPYAEMVAERFETRHHPEVIDGDITDLLPSLVSRYGEPFGDSSAVPSFFVCSAARRHVTVAMNGDGGDELLGGYPRYWMSDWQRAVASCWRGVLSPGQLEELATSLGRLRSLPARMLRRVIVDYGFPEIRSLNMYDDFWGEADRVRLLPTGRYGNTVREWRLHWLEGAMSAARSPVDRMLWYDNRTYLAGDLLVKMDIASMHCSLETRSPLLDHEVIEFCAALPDRLKVSKGVGKYLLKKLAEKYFPADFVHRRKMGFGVPVDAWLRGPLKGILEATLRDRSLMAPMDETVVGVKLDEFLGGVGDHASRMWLLLMYGSWRRWSAGAQ